MCNAIINHYGAFFKNNGHGTERILIYCFSKQGNNLLRCGICSNIPVLWLSADQKVPDTAAYNICLKTSTFEGFCYMCNIPGDTSRTDSTFCLFHMKLIGAPARIRT